jgi:hypothetical protein
MLTLKENRTFATILADGLIHINVEEGTEGGKWREYKTSDGTVGKKFEKVYSEVIGKITKIGFQEGKFGVQLQLTITDGEEEPTVLCMSTSSNYGEDCMKKLPNVDLNKTVKIVPFSFKDDKGKAKKGVTIFQKDDKGETVKLANYFYDATTKANINGYPTPKPTKKERTSDQWKLYYGETREFLIEFITEKFKIDETAVAEVDPIGDNW